MGVSSGWNLVARRPPRLRVVPAPKPSARHLTLVPSPGGDEDGRSPGGAPRGTREAPPGRDAG